jgi:hypothetical protein
MRALFFAAMALPLLGNSVNFGGYTFNSFYGPENLVINGLGHLETPTTATVSFFGGGGHNTSAAFRAAAYQTVTATTLEVGVGNQPSSQLWIQDFAGSILYEAMFGSFSGGAVFRLQTRVRDLTQAGAPSIDTDNYFFTPRTAGAHTFGASLIPNGDVLWLLDGVLVATTGPGAWGAGPGEIERVLLFAHGTAGGQVSTWTNFSLSNVPEPATMIPVAAGIVAVLIRSRRK